MKHLRHKDLLLVAHKMSGEFTDEEREILRRKAAANCIDDCTMTIKSMGGFNSYQLLIFDSYVIEQLSFFQLLRHRLRKLWTAILRQVGASPVIVVVSHNRD